MYMGELGQGATGERFRIISSRKGGRVICPAGTTQESAGVLGTGQKYVWCHRAPQFAKPPTTTVTYEAPRTTVSVPTAVSTQVSPQISPAMAQQQASPGATAGSAPVSSPGGTTARPSTGITGEDLDRILAAQRAAAAAEREAAERSRSVELETLREEMAARSRATQEIALAQQKAAADRAEQERYAREQAEAAAAQSAQALPPPASTTYAPTGGGALPVSMPMPTGLPDAFAPEQTTVDVSQAPAQAGTPWALLLMAAAGVGVVVLAGAKSKRKSRVKK